LHVIAIQRIDLICRIAIAFFTFALDLIRAIAKISVLLDQLANLRNECVAAIPDLATLRIVLIDELNEQLELCASETIASRTVGSLRTTNVALFAVNFDFVNDEPVFVEY
jgi:hypothetical protein